jgi:hypothetical protein
MSRKLWFAPLLLVTMVVLADEMPETGKAVPTAEGQERVQEREQEEEQEQARERRQNEPKQVSGMSILGNQEAPKSLVIVPWKSSEIGDSLGVSTMLDDSRQPVDREVFMRELSYYEIRSQTTP